MKSLGDFEKILEILFFYYNAIFFQIWDNSWEYVSDDKPCMSLSHPGNAKNQEVMEQEIRRLISEIKFKFKRPRSYVKHLLIICIVILSGLIAVLYTIYRHITYLYRNGFYYVER